MFSNEAYLCTSENIIKSCPGNKTGNSPIESISNSNIEKKTHFVKVIRTPPSVFSSKLLRHTHANPFSGTTGLTPR